MKIYQSCFNTPIGPLLINSNENGLKAIHFADELKSSVHENSISQKAITQLQEYFNGKRRRFTLPLDMVGTDFQMAVWHIVKWIPFGETRSYLDIALKLGDKKAVRAVGLAVGLNPFPIVIPCHRVVGANNKLVGYIGGVKRKSWLLEHERAVKPHPGELF